jgi:hypothetical protein
MLFKLSLETGELSLPYFHKVFVTSPTLSIFSYQEILARTASSSSNPAYVPGGRECFAFNMSLVVCANLPPAILKGTVNDPTTFPPPSRSHGSHHWAFERLLSASLVPLTAAAVVTTGSQYPVVDGLLGVALVMHSHIGVRFTLVLSFAFPSKHRDFHSLMPCGWTTFILANSL